MIIFSRQTHLATHLVSRLHVYWRRICCPELCVGFGAACAGSLPMPRGAADGAVKTSPRRKVAEIRCGTLAAARKARVMLKVLAEKVKCVRQWTAGVKRLRKSQAFQNAT